jgi:hypothetical protein
MIRNETRHDRDWYGILRTPAQAAVPRGRAVVHEVAVPRESPPEDLTLEEQLLDEVCALEACATQYENLWAAGRALTALGRLKERIPVDMRARVVTTCLYAATSRIEDAAWPALRARRDRARDALRSLRAVAPAELVWEIDELLETGQWNTQKRFPQAVG